MLRRLLDLPLLVLLMGLAALAMLIPAAHAASVGQFRIMRTFVYSGGILLVLTAMIAIATANWRARNPARGHLAALVLAYLILPVMLAVPFHQAVRDTTFFNAWFEMVSAFTTTGATLYDMTGRLADSLHLWRAVVGWLGGLFMLVAATAILAPMNLGGAEVLTGRVPGRGGQGLSQITRIADPSARIVRVGLVVAPVYGALTLVLWVALAMAGDPGFLALCRAMATLSTSGILPAIGVVGTPSGFAGEVLVAAFLCVALSRRLLPGGGLTGTEGRLRDDPELRMAGALVLLVPGILFLRHWIGATESGDLQDLGGAGRALWGALFTTLSFLTTTGFESVDWVTARSWSGLGTPGLVLAGLAIMGGGVATTAGGVKLLRVYALFRHGERELERLVHPSSIGGAGGTARRLRREGAYVAWIFFMLFALSIAAVSVLLAAFRIDFEPAVILAIAALTNCGPLAAVAAETSIRYIDIPTGAKAVLGAAMILGRLETLAILALLAPDSWRR